MNWHARYLIALWVLLLLLPACSPPLSKAREAEQKKAYYEAATLYSSIYRNTSAKKPREKGYMAYHAAENYRRLRAYSKALSHYRSALRYAYPDSIVLFRIGQMLQTEGNYQEALTYYNRYINYQPHSLLAQNATGGCLEALRPQEEGAVYQIERAEGWSSSRSDYGATYSPDGQTIYWGSNRKREGSDSPSTITGETDGDIYKVERDNYHRWGSKPDTLLGEISTPADEGTPTVSADGNTLYYSYAEQSGLYSRTVKVYKSERAGGKAWGRGSKVEIWGDSTTMAAHPSLSPSGKTLLFVSDVAGGLGGKDIYAIRIDDGRLGTPVNIGQSVNTAGDELYPSAVSDSLFFFASDGHPGRGGLDIYKAVLLPSGAYTISHLPAPINSPADEYSFALAPRNSLVDTTLYQQEGLLSSSRGDARGYPHLYHFRLPKMSTMISGYVSDREGAGIGGATVRLVGNTAERGEQITTTKSDGSYELIAQGDVDYVILASAEGYLNQYARFRTDTAKVSETYNVDFYLASRTLTEALREVYYAFDKAELLPESFAQIDELYRVLTDNPDIRIRLSAHTDRWGNEGYNQALSERRAHSVLRYLIEKGIAPERIETEGVGKSRPYQVRPYVAEQYHFLKEGDVLTEEFVSQLPEAEQKICDALNRRTEFVVLPTQ